MAKETRFAAAETVMELMDPLSSPLTTELSVRVVYGPCLPDEACNSAYLCGKTCPHLRGESLPFGNCVVWNFRQGEEARVLLLSQF